MRPLAVVTLAALSSLGCSRAGGGSAASEALPKGAVVQVVSATDLTCARTKSGDVLCWGDDAFTSTTMSTGSLAPPTRTRPTPVEGVKGAVAIGVAASLGCAIDSAGSLLCWTDRAADRRGLAPPLKAVATGVGNAAELSLEPAATPRVCVRKQDRTVTCLSAKRESLPRDEQREEALERVEAFAAGGLVSCATRDGGKLACWGSLAGLKTQKDALAGPPLLEGVKSLSAGSAFACAVNAASKVACFGLTKGTPPAGPAKLVRAGVYHACLVDTSGHVACWGDDRFGQLGESGPHGVKGVDDAVDVAVGEWHTCALEKSGRVLCWGRNARGQLGDGTSVDRRAAREVSFASPESSKRAPSPHDLGI